MVPVKNFSFIGTYQVVQDSKNRIAIPSRWRPKLGEEIYISKGYENSLVIRTIEEFDQYCSSFIAENENMKGVRDLKRFFLGNSHFVELDKWGRFVLPKELTKNLNLGDNISLLGSGNLIEIWNPKELENYMSQTEKLLEKTGEMMSQKTI